MSDKNQTSEQDSECILHLLDSGNFQTYNREIARSLKSINAAILLSELINRYFYHKNKNEFLQHKLHPGDWFYYTIEKCEERTCLSPDEQVAAIKILEKMQFFEKKSLGVPAKRHFKLNLKAIISFASNSKNVSSFRKIPELDQGKSQNKIEENPRTYKEPKEEHSQEPPSTKKDTVPQTPKLSTRSTGERDSERTVSLLKDGGIGQCLSSAENGLEAQRFAKRFRLDPQQQETLLWLLNQNMGTETETLCYWAKCHSQKKLTEWIEEAKRNKAKCLGSYVRSLIKRGAIVQNDTTEANTLLAKDLISTLGLRCFSFSKKFLRYSLPNGEECDIPLHMQSDNFLRELTRAFDRIERYS